MSRRGSLSRPSALGTVVYLDANGRLDRTLALAVVAGGSSSTCSSLAFAPKRNDEVEG